MKQIKKILSLILLSSLLSAENKDILWVEYDLVPTSILYGEFKGRGVNQKVRRDIQKKFDAYHYTVEENIIARMIKMYQKYPNICGILAKSAEREAFVYFSKVFNWALPNGLIVREDDLDRYNDFLNSDNEIMLEKLLGSKKFTIGYVGKRAYGVAIDKVIQNDDGTLLKLDTSEEKQMELLVKYKRVDALFDYPMKAGYFFKKYGYKVRYLPVENMKISTIHIACSKSELGKKFIEEVDLYIVDQRTKQFLQYNLEWLDTPTQEFLREKIKILSEDTGK